MLIPTARGSLASLTVDRLGSGSRTRRSTVSIPLTPRDSGRHAARRAEALRFARAETEPEGSTAQWSAKVMPVKAIRLRWHASRGRTRPTRPRGRTAEFAAGSTDTLL